MPCHALAQPIRAARRGVYGPAGPITAYYRPLPGFMGHPTLFTIDLIGLSAGENCQGFLYTLYPEPINGRQAVSG
jgi:hypothetical protein